ncbi:hypothetical protein ACWEQL_41360 [Kitasatospora sp. NPDC004240]
MPESRRHDPPEFVPHEVVRDLGHRVDGRPREGVFLEHIAGRAYLRPLGGGEEWTTRLTDLESCSPREIAPGSAGKPHRRRLNDEAT